MYFGLFVCNGSFFKITKQSINIKNVILSEYYFFIVLYQDPHGRSKLFSVPSRERSKGKGFNINVSVKPGTIQKKCLTHWSYYWQIVCEWFENFRNFPSKYLCFSGKKS